MQPRSAILGTRPTPPRSRVSQCGSPMPEVQIRLVVSAGRQLAQVRRPVHCSFNLPAMYVHPSITLRESAWPLVAARNEVRDRSHLAHVQSVTQQRRAYPISVQQECTNRQISLRVFQQRLDQLDFTSRSSRDHQQHSRGSSLAARNQHAFGAFLALVGAPPCPTSSKHVRPELIGGKRSCESFQRYRVM